MTDWVGRSAPELAPEASTPVGLYCWLRASGKTAEQAVAEIAHRSGYTAAYNIERLADQCARAEERERARAAAQKSQPKVFEAESLTYTALRSGGGLSRREATDEVARRFRHGKVNRPLLEKHLAEVERKRFPRPEVDVDAVASDASSRLAELERARIRLAPDALVDGDVMAELEQVEHEIRSCKRTLELVSLARSGQVEEKVAA